jgi:serine/threonine protein kinase
MRIGGGGSCEVFRGVLKGVDVAVKILKQGQGKTPSDAGLLDSILSSEGKQFFAEMRLLKAVQHPNICQLLAVSLDGPHRW